MRYMFLVYSVEDGAVSPELLQSVAQRHRQVMDEAARQGVFESAEPLKPTNTATTVRTKGDKALLVDGPFAETKEQLAGYYILNCRDLDEAIEWAKKIPTGCKGGEGCIEIRPLQEGMH
ncbi:MAG TPA: YciI family protein [Terriglobales bacterium]|nr:YciI family protein [Terriglobales bacterium]